RFFRIDDVITDTAEKINVIGTAASLVRGSGTNQVTIPHLDFLSVDVEDGNDVVNVQSINYGTDVRHSGPGIDTVNVGHAGSLQGLVGIQGQLNVQEGGAGSLTHLNVDNSADTSNHNTSPFVTLSSGAILNLAPAPITDELQLSSDSVTVSGGSGNNIWT